MQVTETAAAGLKREYRVVVPLSELAEKVGERLDEIKGRVQLRGFRPGKVPASHLKRLYGKSAMAEVVEAAVREANSKIVTDNNLKLATEPKVVLPTEEGAIEGVIDGKSDLSYTVEMEIVPPIALADFKTFNVERLTAPVEDSEVDQAVQTIADQSKPFVAKDAATDGGAENGDRITVSFVGTMDGTPFEGGSGDDVPIVLGAGQFIPGFEEQLIGVKAGESRTVNVKFPENYQAAAVAGKDASFAVTVKSVEAPGAVTLDDDFAKTLGLESFAKLKDMVRERIEREHAGMSRQKLKRVLLDQLDAKHKFDPPPTLVEQEFNSVWETVENDLKQQGRTFADEDTTEEKAREEYRGIAERRVRLGLVIAEIGEKNDIKVSEDQLTQAVLAQARMVPGQEQKVWEYYRSNPNALAALRAPIFEDKVIDFLLELANVTDKQVSREELFKEEE
ncbi:MAG TPA: trigger factor [Xanthobacteraceae bacterium]|nr:trigger factor [Xanthobacteraceae bacterium]